MLRTEYLLKISFSGETLIFENRDWLYYFKACITVSMSVKKLNIGPVLLSKYVLGYITMYEGKAPTEIANESNELHDISRQQYSENMFWVEQYCTSNGIRTELKTQIRNTR